MFISHFKSPETKLTHDVETQTFTATKLSSKTNDENHATTLSEAEKRDETLKHNKQKPFLITF